MSQLDEPVLLQLPLTEQVWVGVRVRESAGLGITWLGLGVE